MGSAGVIRVVIIDDHDIVRRGLAMFLSGFDDLELVGEASTAVEAVRVCGDCTPDVVLMDMVMPDTDGVSLTATLKRLYPALPIVILSSSKEDHQIQGALQAGAIGYLLKNVSVFEMAETIRAAHAGKPMLAPEVTQRLINMTVHPHPAPPQYNLTQRESQILALMVEGLNNQDIADRIFVSRATVKVYVSTILSKLGVQNRIEAVRLAVQNGLV
ncbi:MAG: response regulator transcription factor [Anaerolineae bacterium]|jgi:NarL family two-component system response regulator LiaR|nr:response regulator transcription factor [Anaerolineae bacterium]